MNIFYKDPEILVKIGTYINSKINRIETYIAIFFIITIIIQQLLNQSLSSVFAGFLLLLAMAYFFSSTKYLHGEADNGINRFILKLIGYGSSIAVIGILFTFASWPGYDISLNAGGLVLIINLLAILYVKLIKKDEQIITNRIIIRIVILSLIYAFLIFIPENCLIETRTSYL